MPDHPDYFVLDSREEQPLGTGDTVLDSWEIVRKIGEGGQASVYEIRSAGLTELRCALKVIEIPHSAAELDALREDSTDDAMLQRELDEQVSRVQREVRAMAAIAGEPAAVHLEDCRAYRFDEDGTRRIMIRMELLRPLTAVLKERPMKQEEILRLGTEIGELLQVCEEEGILHRDIKPANLFVTARGRYKLGDFGLARASGTLSSSMSHGVGTDQFMAPEVARALDEGEYDARADQYSLALVLYTLLNGNVPPFAEGGISKRAATIRRLKNETPIPEIPGVPDWLNRVLLKELSYRPEDRYPDAKTFAEALRGEPLKTEEPVPEPIPPSEDTEALFERGWEAKGREDYAEAVRWFLQAAAAGNAKAQNSLGDACFYGQGVPKDYTEAVTWYRMAANQGYPLAQSNMGYCFSHGLGVQQNYMEAARWYRMAAEQGFDNAQNNLGELYYYGRGVAQDYAEAARWYRMAAEQGYDSAQYCLGYSLEYGKGVEKDPVKAGEWYRKAAAQGHDGAQFRLGELYYYGRGVAQDYEEAVRWYWKAAEKENGGALYSLGYCCEKGLGMPKNPSGAEDYYRRAVEQGNENAREALARLKS